MPGGLCNGRVCIVTGAGRGIGRAHALELARQGAHVVVNDLGTGVDGSGADSSPAHDVVTEIVSAGGVAVADTEDVASWDGSKALVERTIEHFGRLDVLVNNAGILRDRMLVNMSEGEWDAVIRVHLKGTFAPSHMASQYWRDETRAGRVPEARIINTTSASGIYGNIGQANYGAAKMGIAAFTIIASMELARYGVTVNAIAPISLTRMTEALVQLEEDEVDLLSPDWVSPVCAWLASSQSAGVTGRVFEASGRELAVAEGWVRGPTSAGVKDAWEVDAVARRLLEHARPNANMEGSVAASAVAGGDRR